MQDTANQSNLDKYKERRIMPRVLIPERTLGNKKNSFLVSGNLDYFIRYGIALIDSHLQNGGGTGLIINCVDFSLETANSLIERFFGLNKLNSVFLLKTDFSSMIISTERKLSYLKTIRYYVALKLRLRADINLIIGDIDALVAGSDFELKYNQLASSSTTFGVGSTYDFLSEGLYNAASINYLWRTVKAGFTFFKRGENGLQALGRIVQSLFNIQDKIPPTEELKLYRSYYGDQLAILLTSLELNDSPKKEKHSLNALAIRTIQ